MRLIRRARGQRGRHNRHEAKELASRPAVANVPADVRAALMAWMQKQYAPGPEHLTTLSGRRISNDRETCWKCIEADWWRVFPMLAAWWSSGAVDSRLERLSFGEAVILAGEWLATPPGTLDTNTWESAAPFEFYRSINGGKWSAAWYDQQHADEEYPWEGLLLPGKASKWLNISLVAHAAGGFQDWVKSTYTQSSWVYFRGGAPVWLVGVEPAGAAKPADVTGFSLTEPFPPELDGVDEVLGDPDFQRIFAHVFAADRRRALKGTDWD
jgi:hypothetical protein